MSSSTSLFGADQPVSGLLLNVGNASSPETMTTIANVTDFSLPVVANTVDVTNVGDLWHRRAPTLLDMGKIGFKVYWQPEDPTHNNGTGLRFFLINSLLRDYQFVYPGDPSAPPTDAFPAYVVEFAIMGKVGGVFEATVTLANSGAPSLC